MMNINEVKQHFGVTKPTRPVHAFTVGPYLVHWQMANDFWAMYAGESEYRQWISLTTITHVTGMKMRKLIIGKLSIIVGRMDQ